VKKAVEKEAKESVKESLKKEKESTPAVVTKKSGKK
jgi:hypothetical protein